MKMKVGIIGLGLIGGSLALDLKAKESISKVYAFDINPDHCAIAERLGLVDDILSFDKLIANVDVIVLATPVDVLMNLLPKVLDKITNNQTVIDTGSTKELLIQSVAEHQMRKRFVPCHPMAGTEFSGPEAAIMNLFDGKINVVCDKEASDVESLDMALEIFNLVGMKSIFQKAKEHDVHTAYVSHISHISSFALALTVLKKEKDENQIFDLASGGFDSTVRLAKSSPKTWAPIFAQNRNNVLDVLDEHINILSSFRSALIKNDFEQFNEMMVKANDIKRILNSK